MDSSSEEYRISRRPTGDQSSGGWSLVRAKAKGALKVVSLADDFFGLEVHYWSGRTTPCRAMGCPACEAGLLSRWAGYLPCVQLPKWNLVIVEFTAAACADLDGHRESLKQLRGVNLLLELSRNHRQRDELGMRMLQRGPCGLPMIAEDNDRTEAPR